MMLLNYWKRYSVPFLAACLEVDRWVDGEADILLCSEGGDSVCPVAGLLIVEPMPTGDFIGVPIL